MSPFPKGVLLIGPSRQWERAREGPPLSSRLEEWPSLTRPQESQRPGPQRHSGAVPRTRLSQDCGPCQAALPAHPLSRGGILGVWGQSPPASPSLSCLQIKSDKQQLGSVIYSIQGPGVDEEPRGIFSIDKFTGRVFLNAMLDREETDRFRVGPAPQPLPRPRLQSGRAEAGWILSSLGGGLGT